MKSSAKNLLDNLVVYFKPQILVANITIADFIISHVEDVDNWLWFLEDHECKEFLEDPDRRWVHITEIKSYILAHYNFKLDGLEV